METWFDWEAKIVNDKMFRTSALMQVCMENQLKPRSLTEAKLIELGMGRDKIPMIRPILAEKILEFYWLQARELKNANRVKSCWVTPEHYNYITNALSIEWSFAKFQRMNCWDRVDSNGDSTQFDKLKESFGTIDTATQEIVKVSQEDTDNTLINWYKQDIKRIEKELTNPWISPTIKDAMQKELADNETPLPRKEEIIKKLRNPKLTEEREKALLETKNILQSKLDVLNENNAWGDWQSK